jgi:ABC-type phosphate transport system substrate-binding protein
MLNVTKTFMLLLLAVFLTVSVASAQTVVLVASPDVPVDSISASDLKNIFLGKKSSWDNGGKITFFTNGGAAHDAFLKDYVGKSPSQFSTFWKKQVFTGKGKMPDTAGSDQDMVTMVAGTGGAIGYVSAGADINGLKAIAVK